MEATIDWVMDVCFNLISVKESRHPLAGPQIIQRWKRPPTNALKVNALMAPFQQMLAQEHADGVFWYTKHVHYTLVWT
jgi:hypothetical protein